MTTSTTVLAGAPPERSGNDPAPVERHAPAGIRTHRLRGFVRRVEEAGLLLLVAFMVPLAILAIGTPIVLLARLVAEIARRW